MVTGIEIGVKLGSGKLRLGMVSKSVEGDSGKNLAQGVLAHPVAGGGNIAR